MIVLRSTYNELAAAHRALAAKYLRLLADWNDLVAKVNERGGIQALNNSSQLAFTRDDLKRLIMLCHPDKHGGKRIAEEMTQKLLAMRASL